jgi:hypothetical protein
MQFKRTSEIRIVSPFISRIEDIPGGVTVAVGDLAANLTAILAGTPVGIDSNGLGHVIKQAVLQAAAANTDVGYKVLKGHGFKVGDYVFNAVGQKNYVINTIDTSNGAYDTITIATTLGVVLNIGDVIYQGVASAGATSGAFFYTPIGLTTEGIDINAGDNHLVGVVLRGSVRIANLLNGAGAPLIAALPLIRFVS